MYCSSIVLRNLTNQAVYIYDPNNCGKRLFPNAESEFSVSRPFSISGHSETYSFVIHNIRDFVYCYFGNVIVVFSREKDKIVFSIKTINLK